MNNQIKKSILWGIGGGLSLLILYFLILTLANSFSHALDQLQLLWYWILALVIGFSLQVGLYSYIRQRIRESKTRAATNKELAATSGISTGSMVACCAHHLVDVLPILGLSAIFLFLAEYQVFFILIGILSNIVGIVFMLEIIKKHSLSQEVGLLKQISRFNIKRLRNQAIMVSVFILLISFFWIRNNNLQESTLTFESSAANLGNSIKIETTSWPSRIDDQGGLSIEVTPINFSFDQEIQFRIALNTHQGDLDFDLTKKSVLIDDLGNQYFPKEWQGDRGGHHLTGILIFSAITTETKKIKLIINNVYGAKERSFKWDK